MKGHSVVANISNLGSDVYLIERTRGKPDLRILIVDIYITGEADIYEINAQANGINGIVLVGYYNRYSNAAKTLAKHLGIGLFDNREFFGAVNFSGKYFINYEPKGK